MSTAYFCDIVQLLLCFAAVGSRGCRHSPLLASSQGFDRSLPSWTCVPMVAVTEPTTANASLSELTAAGKHGRFLVQVKWQEISTYQYTLNATQKEGRKLTVLLASADEGCYVSASMRMWKGNEKELTDAAERLKEGRHFVVSDVHFLSEKPAYIHTPLKEVIDIRQSKFTPVLQSTQPEFRLAPRTALADMLSIRTGRHRFDVTALVSYTGAVRNVDTRYGQRVAQDIVLMDGSKVASGEYATVQTSILFATAEEHDTLKADVDAAVPVTFFGLDMQFLDGVPKVTPAFAPFWWRRAVGEKAVELSEPQMRDNILHGKQKPIAATWAPNVDRDYSTEQAAWSTAGFLDAHKVLRTQYLNDHLFQMNAVHIPYPPPADIQLEDRLWWVTTVRDATGTLEVGLRQKAILQLAGLDAADVAASQEAFLQDHRNGTFSWPLLASVKLVASFKAEEDEVGRLRLVVVEAEPQSFQARLTLENITFLHGLSVMPPRSDALVVCRLQDLTQNSFGILQAAQTGILPPRTPDAVMSLDQLQGHHTRAVNCGRALVFLISTEKTQQLSVGAQSQESTAVRLLTKNVIDGLTADEAVRFSVLTYCARDTLKDFVLDPPRSGSRQQAALAIIAGVQRSEEGPVFCLEQLELVAAPDVDDVLAFMKHLWLLQCSIYFSDSAQQVPNWSEADTPVLRAIKCPRLGAYPGTTPLPSPTKVFEKTPAST